MSKRKPIPRMPWSAPHLWSFRPTSLLVLCLGLLLCGVGDSLLFRSALGNSPWTVLADGISKHTDVNIAWITLFISLSILIIWRIWHIQVGLGTLLNTFIGAFVFYCANQIIPSMQEANSLLRIIMCLGGTALIAVGSAIYISCYLGTGARDGLMVAISGRYNKPLAWVRTGLELFACISGFLLGGTLGLGTLIFAFLVGPVLGIVVGRLKKQYLITLKKQHQQDRP